MADFSVRLEPAGIGRSWFRTSIFIAGDHMLPDAAPMALRHGLLAAEMGMNLQMALGWRRHVLLHASCVEKDGRALVMTGESGSGKSTLAALLGEHGWRLLGDEFVLLDLHDCTVWPFPRLVSLKNSAIPVLGNHVGADRLGPVLDGTPKGTIRHLVPNTQAVAGMLTPAIPVALLFPRYGQAPDMRPVGQGEMFMRLTQASTNYVALGEAGFRALTGFVKTVPGMAIDYPDGDTAMAMVQSIWDGLV